MWDTGGRNVRKRCKGGGVRFLRIAGWRKGGCWRQEVVVGVEERWWRDGGCPRKLIVILKSTR